MSINNVLWIFGMIIAFVLGRSITRKKEQKDNINNKVNDDTSIMDTGEMKIIKKKNNIQQSAKEAFIMNIGRFTPYFNQLLQEQFDAEDWTDTIIDINNDELIEYWKRVHSNVDSILRMLAMWGVRRDTCTSFTSMKSYVAMYDTEDGTSLIDGVKYEVITPCWILTDMSTGAKKIVLKGVVTHE